jgi:hypothetical protein
LEGERAKVEEEEGLEEEGKKRGLHKEGGAEEEFARVEEKGMGDVCVWDVKGETLEEEEEEEEKEDPTKQVG